MASASTGWDSDGARSVDLFATSCLAGTQEGLDQFALAAHRQFRESLDHRPSGASGSVSSHSISNVSCAGGRVRSLGRRARVHHRPTPGIGQTFTRDEWWVAELQKHWTKFFQTLPADNVARLHTANLYPLLGAPSFSQFGGAVSNGVIVLEFLAISHRSYAVQTRPSLSVGSWQPPATVRASLATFTATFTHNNSDASRFYRLVTPASP